MAPDADALVVAFAPPAFAFATGTVMRGLRSTSSVAMVVLATGSPSRDRNEKDDGKAKGSISLGDQSADEPVSLSV